ncbi:hypothetical protein ACQKWADRAFT_285075 [Trichoderma austrokoningii]
MAATLPLITSDLPFAPPINKAREHLASTGQMASLSPPATSPASQQQSMAGSNTMGSPLATTPGASAIGAATKLSPEDTLVQRLVRSASESTNASNGVVENVTERSGSNPHSHYSKPQQDGISPNQTMASIAPMPPINYGIAMPYQRGQENQNGPPHRSSVPPKPNQAQGKSSAYTALLELVRTTDPSVVRQVVRENWQKCLTGSDYHSAFVARATITCSPPTVLSGTLSEIGNIIVKTSGREIAKHFGTEDLDQAADLFGPRFSPQFQDRVMAARLETIGAQDLINALSRAERLGYHINDIVQKQPGPGGETVIPSMSAVPPVPPHNGGAPPPAMAPYQVQRPPPPPPPQPQPYGGQMSRMTHQAYQGPSQTPKRSAPALPSWAVQCRVCNRPCSSEDALSYHLKKAKCDTVSPHLEGDVCVHCGCHFESPGGLSYHSKSDVCGKHDEEKKAQMTAILQQKAWSQPVISHAATPPGMMPVHAAANAAHTPVWKQAPAAPSSTPSPSGNDPYAKLSETDRIKFDAEMRGVDEYYGNLMREASKLPPGKRQEEIGKLKNRYNTKQSNTRKKYGIRLRERRSNADVGNTSAAKRARTDDGPAGPIQPAASSQSPFPSVKESPRMRVPLSKMGGLSVSSATAELVDPTASSTAANGKSSAPATTALGVVRAPHDTPQGTASDPMQIDNESSSGTSTDSEDVDIPARIH